MAADPITGAEELITTAINKWLPDADQKGKDALQLQLAQIAANAADATQPGFHFRDGAGWVCVAAMACNFVARPLVAWGSTLIGHPIDMPELDSSQLWPIMTGLLGLGGMHTYEQTK